MEFVETDILLCAYFSSGEKQEIAGALVDRLWSERRGALSIQVLQEFTSTPRANSRNDQF